MEKKNPARTPTTAELVLDHTRLRELEERFDALELDLKKRLEHLESQVLINLTSTHDDLVDLITRVNILLNTRHKTIQ